MRKTGILMLTVLLAVCFTVSVKADYIPYASFDQTDSNTGLPAPASYAPVSYLDGAALGGDAWNAPQDMMFDKQGNLVKRERVYAGDRNADYIHY